MPSTNQSHDQKIAHAALELDKQIERDKLEVSDSSETIAERLIANAATYRALLAPWDATAAVDAAVPLSVTLTPKAT